MKPAVVVSGSYQITIKAKSCTNIKFPFFFCLLKKKGMTVNQQKEIMQQFKSGKLRLLVATPFAQEGLDIPECNLVIKYNHVGNEVTTVQTRGRFCL